MTGAWSRVFLALAGLAGASGVGLAAAAAHVGGPNLATAAQMLLVHAPAFLGLSALLPAGERRLMIAIPGMALALGLLLFSGTLALGVFATMKPFPMAAPTGGVLMIVGWLALTVAAVLPRR